MQVKPHHGDAAFTAARDRALEQIRSCLGRTCVIRIEHTPSMAPRFSPWDTWAQSLCCNGDPQQILAEIDRCRIAHNPHYIRLNIEDYTCQSRFSLVIHSPDASAPGTSTEPG
jgi:ribulose bisphosphate carboxylase small subunit